MRLTTPLLLVLLINLDPGRPARAQDSGKTVSQAFVDRYLYDWFAEIPEHETTYGDALNAGTASIVRDWAHLTMGQVGIDRGDSSEDEIPSWLLMTFIEEIGVRALPGRAAEFYVTLDVPQIVRDGEMSLKNAIAQAIGGDINSILSRAADLVAPQVYVLRPRVSHGQLSLEPHRVVGLQSLPAQLNPVSVPHRTRNLTVDPRRIGEIINATRSVSIEGDVDGDGLLDVVILGPRGFEVMRNTGVDWVAETSLNEYLLGLRIGFISSYYLSLVDGMSAITSSSPTVAAGPSQPPPVDASALSGAPSFDMASLQASIETLAEAGINPPWWLGLTQVQTMATAGRLQASISRGIGLGTDAGTLLAIQLAQFSEPASSVAVRTVSLSAMASQAQELSRGIERLELVAASPLFRPVLRAPDGTTVPLNGSASRVTANASVDDTVFGRFVAKMSQNFRSSAPPAGACKALREGWQLCNPAILAGQVSAFVAVLSALSRPNPEDVTKQDLADQWFALRQRFEQARMSVSSSDVSAAGTGIAGVTALQFRHGFSYGELFVNNAQTIATWDAAATQTAKQIVDELAQRFPDFQPNSVAGPEDATTEIARFIGGLYSRITTLEEQNRRLQYDLNELRATNDRLQQTLTSATALLNQMSGTVELLDKNLRDANSAINEAERAMSNAADLFGYLSKAAELHHYGSSIAIAGPVARDVVEWGKKTWGSAKRGLARTWNKVF